MDFSATYVRASDQYLSASQEHTSLTGDFTFECWWKPASLTAGQDQTFWQANHSLGGTPVRIWKTDAAGVNKLRLRCQEVGGAAPAAAEHVEVEWDIDALVSVSTWVHIAIAFDVSQAVATIAELYVDSVSQGNGSVISGTDCSSLVVADANQYVGSDGSGAAVDGQLFNLRFWLDDRTGTEISDNYQLVTRVSNTGLLVENLYKSGRSHVNASYPLSTTLFSEVNGPIEFAPDIPADINQEAGTAPGGAIYGVVDDGDFTGAGELIVPGGGAEIIEPEVFTGVPWVGQPAEVVELSSTTSAPAFIYRMRGFDGGLNRTVYWTTEAVDPLADEYTGPGPVTDIVVSNVICQR